MPSRLAAELSSWPMDILTLRIERVCPDKHNSNLLAYRYEWFYFGHQEIRRGFLAECRIDERPVLRDLKARYRKLIGDIEDISQDEILSMLFAIDGVGSRGELNGLKPVERRMRDAKLKRMLSDLQKLSADLTEWLIPQEVTDELGKLAEDTPVLLITDQLDVPWELLQVSPPQFLPLWGTKFALGRLLLTSQLVNTRPLDLMNPRILYINPLCVQADPLPESWLRNGVTPEKGDALFSTAPIQLLTRKYATYQRVVRSLEEGDYDLIYYSGHVQTGDDGQAQLAVYDEASVDFFDQPPSIYITADTIEMYTRRRLRHQKDRFSSPLVFLNACKTAALVGEAEVDEEESTLGRLSSYDGLARAFLEYGACAVIATLWPVVYSHSVSFANFLLQCLRVQQYSTIGSVLRVTKGRFREHHQDLAYNAFHFLPYILYGPPSMVEPLKAKETVRFNYWGEQFRFLFDHLPTQALSILPRGLRVEMVEAGYDIVDVLFREYGDGVYDLPFVAVAPQLSVARAYLGGAPIRVVGVLFEPARRGSAVVLARDPETREVADLAGKRVGVTGWHMFPTFALKYCLRKAGLRPVDCLIPGYDAPTGEKTRPRLTEKTVALYNLPQRSLAAVLQHGFLDAILLFWPIMYDKALTIDTVAIADPVAVFWEDNSDISLPVTLFVTHEDFLKAPDIKAAIRSTLDTIMQSHEWVLSHREQIVREQAELYGVPEEQAERLFDVRIHQEVYVSEDSKVVESLVRIWGEAAALGMLPRSLLKDEVQQIVQMHASFERV